MSVLNLFSAQEVVNSLCGKDLKEVFELTFGEKWPSDPELQDQLLKKLESEIEGKGKWTDSHHMKENVGLESKEFLEAATDREPRRGDWEAELRRPSSEGVDSPFIG